jgi:RND superfamily putative drug exporter
VTDALIMRMTLVPALLTLLGERSWTIPRWLDKALPNITIEPPAERDAEGVGRAPEPETAAT